MNKSKIIIIQFLTKLTNQQYKIIYINFKSTLEFNNKIITKYGYNHIDKLKLSKDNHIMITMIPIKKELSEPKFIWQGILNKESNIYEISDQLIDQYHQLSSDNLEELINEGRIVNKLNYQSDIRSLQGDSYELLSTKPLYERDYIGQLMSNDNDSNDDFSLIDRSVKIKQEEIKEEMEKQLNRMIIILHSSIKNFDKKQLKPIVVSKRSLYKLSRREKMLEKKLLIIEHGVPLVNDLLNKPSIREIKRQMGKLKTITKCSPSLKLNNLEEIVPKRIYKRYTVRRPIFYDNQILGLYEEMSDDNYISFPRYTIKHVEAETEEPIMCFVCNVNFIRGLFNKMKKTGVSCLKTSLKQLKQFDYNIYKSQIKQRING
jgi:hypothetical protein